MRSVSYKRLTFASLALAIGLTGCASAGGGSDEEGGRTGGPNRILQEELVDLTQLDAYQAVQRLRARWLRPRGSSTPRVFIDGTNRGGIEELRNIRVADVADMRYMSASDATTRYGTGYEGGAILVTTRR